MKRTDIQIMKALAEKIENGEDLTSEELRKTIDLFEIDRETYVCSDINDIGPFKSKITSYIMVGGRYFAIEWEKEENVGLDDWGAGYTYRYTEQPYEVKKSVLFKPFIKWRRKL